ncbi:MAG: hypothetical protein ABSB94_13970 [Syntrophorhabdales bacterium]|jgi:hypothetical protein
MRKACGWKSAFLFATVLAFAALVIWSAPAQAVVVTVTNTFNGIIVAGPAPFGSVTTPDTGNYFGGGDLTGQPFSLAFTTTAPVGLDYVTGATQDGDPAYSSPNPITAILTINGHSTGSFGNSSVGYYFGDLGESEYYLKAYTWSPLNQGTQVEGVAVAIVPTNPALADSLTMLLPAMLFSKGGFVNYDPALSSSDSVFYDSNGEELVLNVLAVNTPVPIPLPPGLLLLGSSMVGLMVFRKRIKKA